MATAIKSGSVSVDIIGNDNDIQQKIKRVQNKFNELGKKIQNVFMTTAAIRATFAGFTAPLNQVFTVFSSFEMAMSKVKALTKGTADEIGRLREQAKELGKTTFFTASQVADAQKFLAMAGFNTKQIYDAIPDVLNLSLAGDMDLGMAADIATNISTPFKIAAENLSQVNDILAKAAVSSNTNIQEMGQAFKYAAPAAAAAGQSLEECGAAMAILANNGIKADMAGTSLRMMLIKLADAGIQKKLKEQFDIDAVDSVGKVRPILSILEELKTKTNDLGKAAQMSVFYDIFEQRAGTSAVVLGNAGDAIANFRLKMSDAAGTSAEIAKTMSDNIKGDWIAFISAVEGSQIAFGEAVNTMSREWLQFGTVLMRGTADFIAGHKDLITTTLNLGGSLVGLRLGISIFSSLRPIYASLIPVSATTIRLEQARAVAAGKTVSAITSETIALNTHTSAVRANAAAMAAANAVKTKRTLSSIGGKLQNVNSLIGGLTKEKQLSQNLLQGLSKDKTEWQKMLGGVQVKAIRGSVTALKEQKLIEQEIALITQQENVLKQKLLATEQQLTAANAKRATLANSYLNAGSIAAFRAEQSSMAATAAARRNYLNQLGLAMTAQNKYASTVMVMSTTELAATMRRRMLTAVTAQNIVVTKAATVASYAGAVAAKAYNGVLLTLKASLAAHPIMWFAAAVAGLVALSAWLTISREKSAELNDEMSKNREKGDQSRTVDDKKMQRLKQLSSQHSLSNSEMKEAETLLGQLEGKYDKFGIVIDKTTDSINLAADSMEQFSEAMNTQALQELENELKEGEKNFQELGKQMKQYIPDTTFDLLTSGVFDFRNSQLNTGFGFSENGLLVSTGKKMSEDIAEKYNEQMQKNYEIRKKINAIKGGESAIDVAKDESVLLDEKINSGDNNDDKEKEKEIENAEKKITEMKRQIERDRKTSLENEIADLKERNEEYKKYLKLLIEAEKAKPESQQHKENLSDWENKLAETDKELNSDINRLLDKRLEAYQKMADQAGLSDFEKELADARAKARKDYEEGEKVIDTKIANLDPANNAGEIEKLNAAKKALGEIEKSEVQKIYDKAKVDPDKLALSPLEKEVSEKMAARDDAVADGDLKKIKSAQKELEKAKRELEMTSFKKVQEALKEARANYEKALEAFNNAKEGTDEKAVAGNILNEEEKKLDEIENRYEGMSEKQYNDKIKKVTDKTKEDSLGDMFKSKGTFSAFELNNLDNSVAKEQLNELRIISKEVKNIERKKNVPRFK